MTDARERPGEDEREEGGGRPTPLSGRPPARRGARGRLRGRHRQSGRAGRALRHCRPRSRHARSGPAARQGRIAPGRSGRRAPPSESPRRRRGGWGPCRRRRRARRAKRGGPRPRAGSEAPATAVPPESATIRAARSRSPGPQRRTGSSPFAARARQKAAVSPASHSFVCARGEGLEEREGSGGTSGDPVVHFRRRPRDEVRDVGCPREAGPAENVLCQGEPPVDDVRSRRDVDPLVGDERVHLLGRRPETEADLSPGARGERDPGGLQEPLRVDDDVGLEGAQAPRGRSAAPRVSPPERGRFLQARVVATRTSSTYGAPSTSSASGPSTAQARRSPSPAQRLRERKREDDVAEGGEPYEENLHRRFAILSSSWCSTRRSSS